MTKEEFQDFQTTLDKLVDLAVGNNKPSLPSNLDEAAENSWAVYEYRESPRGLYSTCYLDGFKAGAEWMAGQGHTVEGTFHHSCGYPSVIELKTYIRDYEGADVIVQIRKKQ